MGARELTLNIAVNLGRLGRWASEGRINRLNQFLEETEGFVQELESAPKSPRFQQTFRIFKDNFDKLKNSSQKDSMWIESMYTWANILTHRAQLA